MNLYAIVRKRDEKYRVPNPKGAIWRRKITQEALYFKLVEAEYVLSELRDSDKYYVASFELKRKVDVEALLKKVGH